MNTQRRNRLGQLELDAGHLSEAREQFTRSVESEPNAVGYGRPRHIYLKRGDFERTQHFFAPALGVDPFDSHARFKLGALHPRVGRTAEALREYQLGLVTDPHNREALTALEKLRTESLHAKP